MSTVWGDSGQAPRMASLRQRGGEMRKSVYRSGHICPSWHDTWPFVWCSRQKATVWKFTSISQMDLMNRPKRQCNLQKELELPTAGRNYILYICNNSKKRKRNIQHTHSRDSSPRVGTPPPPPRAHTHSKETHIHLLKFIFYGYFPG